MTPEARAAAHIALAQHTPYLFTDIPEGQTVAEYRQARPKRKRLLTMWSHYGRTWKR